MNDPERLLVDPRLGVVTELRQHAPDPDMPRAWVAYGANVSRTTEFAGFEADRYGFGAALGEPERARRAALGEAVERYCGNVVPRGLPRRSYDALVAVDEPALDPETFALYSPEQYAAAGFPFVPFTRELPVCWVSGRELPTGRPIEVPAALAYLDTAASDVGTPAIGALSYAGIATGETREHAESFALEELLERDASTLWWATGAPCRLIDDADEVVGRLDDPRLEQRTIRLLALPSEFDVPVVAAFVEDHERELVAFGTACRADPRVAAEKALVEAFGLLQLTNQLATPDSDIWRAVAQGSVGASTFVPYRADRSYLDAFRPDFRDLVDLPAVAQLYLDPRMRNGPLERLRETEARARFTDLPSVPPDDARQVYVDRLVAAGLRVASVDLTTPDVRSAGLTVVRVVVPGLYGNAPAAFPYEGGRRIRAALDGREPVRWPIPLA